MAGRERAAAVPLASAWALWWGGDRLAAGFADYWDAPVMQPADDAFALSESEARAMYLQTYHHRPIVNGYSSYWSARYRETRRGYHELVRGRGDRGLRDAGVRFVIAHTGAMQDRGQTLPPDLAWTLRYRDPTTAIEIYELPP